VEDTICRLYRLVIYALQLEIQLSRGKGWDLRYIDINKLLMLRFPVKGKYQSQTAYGFETYNDHLEMPVPSFDFPFVRLFGVR